MERTEHYHEGERLLAIAKSRKGKVSAFSTLVEIGRTALYSYFKKPVLDIEVKEKVALKLGKEVFELFPPVPSEIANTNEPQVGYKRLPHNAHKKLMLDRNLDLKAVHHPENSPVVTKPVPVYDVEFAAGHDSGSFVDQAAASHPVMWLTLPEVIGCDLIIKARGESMTDLIHPRDWIGLKQILDFQNLLAYNQAYAIVAGEFELLKYIKKSSKKGYITLSSENAFYEDFDIPLKSVDQLFLIKVVIPFSKVRSLA